MKILFLLTYYTPYISGLTIYTKLIAEHFAHEGHVATVLAMRHDRSLPKEETLVGVRVIRAKPLKQISKGFISFDWLTKSFSLVYESEKIFVNLPQPEAVIPVLWAKLLGKKVVVIYHCDVVLPPTFVNKLIQTVLTLSHMTTLCFADTIITNTKDYADNSSILKIFMRKIKYIYPPICAPDVDNRELKLLKHKTLRNGCFIIGLVTRMAAEKGIEYMLEAIPDIKRLLRMPFRIVIAGPPDPVGEEHYKKKLRALLDQHKDNLVLLGMLEDQQMGALYSLLDVLVLPSINSTESFGMVQVEAMMTGVPVVVTDLPGLRTPVTLTQMGKIVPSKNSQLLAQAAVNLLLSKRKYKDKIIKVQEEFSIIKTMQAYDQLLDKI